MSIVHVSAVVRLMLRTEEFEATAALEERLPLEGTTATTTRPHPPRPENVQEGLARNESKLRALNAQRPDLAPEDYRAARNALLRERKAIRDGAMLSVGMGRPASVAAGADDQTVVGSILPVRVSVARAGLTTADSCNVELSYSDAPFDPRTLRACGVEVLIGVVRPEDFADGIERGATRGDGSLTSTVGMSADGQFHGATRFVGFVDEWQVKYGDGGDMVTLVCRDMSAPLRDLKISSGDSIDLSLPINEGIAQFLSRSSATTAGVIVRYQGKGKPPVPSAAAVHKRKPRRGKVARRSKRGSSEQSQWDHIVDVCGQMGLIPLVRDFDIVITEARTLYGNNGDSGPVMRMVYGQNIEELSFSRKLAGVKVPTIEVRCYDPTLGRTRWARWPVRRGDQRSGVVGVDKPPRPLRANEVPPSGYNPTESIRTIFVSAVTDPATLERVAQNAFTQIGRQEITGNLTTYDVSSLDVDVFDVDLLDARPADPIEVLIAAATPDTDAVSSVADLQAFARARRQRYLEQLGWSPEVAARFAELQDANGLQTIFRVQDVGVEFDKAEGVKTTIGFINYVTVREDRDDSDLDLIEIEPPDADLIEIEGAA